MKLAVFVDFLVICIENLMFQIGHWNIGIQFSCGYIVTLQKTTLLLNSTTHNVELKTFKYYSE